MEPRRGVVDFAGAAQATVEDLRDRLGLDAWWVTRRSGDESVTLAAADGTFGTSVGAAQPWAGAFCARMLDGEAPQVAPRVDAVPAYAEARAVNGLDVAAVLAVPVTSPQGEVLGALCGASRQEQPALHEMLPVALLQAGILGTLLSHELRLADEVRRAEHAERAAHTDSLTQVGNRRAWDAALAAEEGRAARYASPGAVLVLDVDGLKELNDTAGHDAGDRLLRETAALLRQRLRGSDVVARLGGDEFGVLLPETERAGALAVAEQLRDGLSDAGITASIGVGDRPRAGGLLAAWQDADAAMYAAKVAAARDGRRARPSASRPLTSAPSTQGRPIGTGVDSLLRVVKDQLGVDVAFISSFEGVERRFRNLVSDVALPIAAGDTSPREGTYCQLIATGELAPVTPDVARSPVLSALPVTEALGIGSYVGVPLNRGSGELYGTLCAFSREADPDLRERDARVLTAVARAIMDIIEVEDEAEAARHHVLARLEALHAGGGPGTVFQRVVTLDGLEPVGVEALSRFPDGSPGPAQWFADAAAAGAGTRLELRAVANALEALPAVTGFLAVNVSPATACSPSFARLLDGVPLHRVVVEVTEHEPIDDYTALTAALAPLRRGGLRVAVDDAGAGFASMRHVLALVPDLIKLDTSLVRGIDTDLARQALAAALGTFADTTGAHVVAEGIETAQELECLRALGLRYGQGYHLGRPAPLVGRPLAPTA